MFNCTEYNTVDFILKDALKNYNRRPSLKNSVSKTVIDVTQTYVNLRAHQEQTYEECLYKLYRIDTRLAEHLKSAHQYGVEIDVSCVFSDIVNELCNVNEALTREEAENLGIGSDAKRLRKEWRKNLRRGHEYLNKSVKNKILYIKEWSKPRQVYVLNYTGEIHNGLRWTFRELITHPIYIKYGFEKEER